MKSLENILKELKERGVRCELWSGELWRNLPYCETYSLIQAELSYLKEGNSGNEKIMMTSEELSYVVKIPGDPDFQDFQSGVQSLYEEFHASAHGFNGYSAMAESFLLWHEGGVPLLIQEKLSNLHPTVEQELGESIPWLSKSLYSYAQVGLNSRGEWRFYDLDAGTLSLEGGHSLQRIYERYYGKTNTQIS